jgi:drug/metabolite transporter (DMT)-like permease
MGPVEIAIWRLFSGAAVVGLCWWLKRGEYRMSGRDLLLIAIASLIFTVPTQVIQAYVLEQGFGHGFFGTMVAAIPLLTILVSVPMLGARPSGRELFGVLGGLACMSLLVKEGMHRGMSPGLLALTMTIPVSSALSNNFYKWRLPHVPAAPLTTTILIVSGLALLPLQASPQLMSSLHIAAPSGTTVSAGAITYLLLLGVVGSGISTMAYIWLVIKRGPLFAGMTTYVVPVIALLWGTLDHEAISGQQAMAIAGVLGMVALVQTKSSGTLTVDAQPQAIRVDLAKMQADDALVSLPISAIPLNDRRAVQPESQVA